MCSYIAIAFLLFVTGLIAYDSESRISLYVMGVWAAVLGIGWLVLKSRTPEIADRSEPALEKVG